jgi:transcription antitermination factor NusG
MAVHWYAVRTRSKFEVKVRTRLFDKGVDCYLPVLHETHRWKDRNKEIEVPVFPGYLFTRLVDSSEARLAVLRTEGVVNILGQGERIEPVPEEEIESLRRLLAAKPRCLAHPFLQEGAWVRVKRGVLKNLEGLLVRVKNQTRLVLSITLLSQSVSTEIDAKDVECVRSAEAMSRRVA